MVAERTDTPASHEQKAAKSGNKKTVWRATDWASSLWTHIATAGQNCCKKFTSKKQGSKQA